MRDKKDIVNLANIIQKETDNLPSESYDGVSNDESIELGLETARQLYSASEGNISEVTDVNVSNWLDKKPSELDDYIQ
jgi:hypothetical protein